MPRATSPARCWSPTGARPRPERHTAGPGQPAAAGADAEARRRRATAVPPTATETSPAPTRKAGSASLRGEEGPEATGAERVVVADSGSRTGFGAGSTARTPVLAGAGAAVARTRPLP